MGTLMFVFRLFRIESIILVNQSVILDLFYQASSACNFSGSITGNLLLNYIYNTDKAELIRQNPDRVFNFRNCPVNALHFICYGV